MGNAVVGDIEGIINTEIVERVTSAQHPSAGYRDIVGIIERLGFEKKQAIPDWVLFAGNGQFMASYVPDEETSFLIAGPYSDLGAVRRNLGFIEKIFEGGRYGTHQYKVIMVGGLASSVLIVTDIVSNVFGLLNGFYEYINNNMMGLFSRYVEAIGVTPSNLLHSVAIAAGITTVVGGLILIASDTFARKAYISKLSPEAAKYSFGKTAFSNLEKQLGIQ